MDSNGIQQIIGALEVIHNPGTGNDNRRQAQEFLNRVEQEQESPFWGYQLSLNKHEASINNIVRHFGLTLLQRSIKNHYDSFDLEKSLAIRKWIVELCELVSSSDPIFIKEKLASIWVDIAKRIWGLYLEEDDKEPTEASADKKVLGWVTMDKDLLGLWNKDFATRELSLIIFRTLFEDVYILDDPLATRRSSILTMLCTEVLTPNDILLQYYTRNNDLYESRSTDDGWVLKWSEFLGQCLADNNCSSKESSTFAIRLLSTLKTCFHWILPEVLKLADMLTKLSQCLLVDNVKIKILTIDCLHALFTRSYSKQEDFSSIVGSVFQPQGLNMLVTVYRSIHMDPDDIDVEEYSLLKKLVEMGVGLSSYLNPITSSTKLNPFPLPPDSDILTYLKFILETTCNESLIVSGLSLNFWVTMLRIEELSNEESNLFKILPDLLEVASNRLLNYELLNSEHVTQKYLAIDFDSQPESVAFLGTYKKYLDDITRISICKLPKDGLLWLENRLSIFFASDLGHKVLNQKKFKYNKGADEAFVMGTSQFVIIEASIKGITRWNVWYTNADDKAQKQQELNALVETLFQQLLQLNLKDPMLCKKQIQTLVQFGPLLKSNDALVFNMLEKVLTTGTYEFPSDGSDEDLENIRDLRSSCGTELNRMAYMAPESLGNRFDDLEAAIEGILKSNKISVHESVAFKSFLLIVSQRASLQFRDTRFSQIVDGDLSAWSDPATIKGLNDLHWFMERLGIVKIAEYFRKRNITADTNLLETQMDEEGRQLKLQLKNHWAEVFPIRATRIFLQYSIEKIPTDSDDFKQLLALWKPRIVPILPHILQLISQIQAYHNPKKWVDLPVEVQAFVKYSCAERFWQIGVSSQSRDSFVEESVKATHTLRDFADSLGHIVRYTREYAFLTISSISSLGDTMYEIPKLGVHLWKAVADDTTGVTIHSWKHMIHILLRNVVKNCPIQYFDSFLKDLLLLCLPAIDELLVTRWEKIVKDGILITNETDDELSEEMMEEHLVRQLTAVVDRLLIDLVGQLTSRGSSNISNEQLATRELIFNNSVLLESFLKLVVHIISFKDTKCSYNALLILRGVLNDILLKDESIDKWLCQEVFEILVGILTDDYYQDTHSEAGYLLCEIYITLRTKYSAPRVILQTLSNVNEKTMANMERTLTSSKSLRAQKNCIVQVVISKQNDLFHEEQRKRAINRKKKGETDLISQSLTEDGEGVLVNLFD